MNAQINKFVSDHIGQPHRLIYNDLGSYKYQYENGDTYEVRVINDSPTELHWHTKTIINGQEVQ